jgi:dienelactone hydrolase
VGGVVGRLIARAALALLLPLAGLAAPVEVSLPSFDGGLQLTGTWYAVDAAAGPRPAVVGLHGCDGMRNARGQPTPAWRRRAAQFNGAGMHLLALDSFTPRGLGSVCGTRTAERGVDETLRREDLYAALKWLAAQPGVDATRLFVVGWSHGAQTVLGVVDASDPFVKAQALKPRAAVAFYPGCQGPLRNRAWVNAVPLLMLVGELDDWTPPEPCQRLHGRMAFSSGPAFEFTAYPGAYHGFDSPSPVQVREGLVNLRAGRAHVGGNPDAAEQSRVRMLDFLQAQMR